MSGLAKCCQLCHPFRQCYDPTTCQDCGVTFCSLCYSSHVSSCKNICEGKFLYCQEHSSLVYKYCVHCCKLCCLSCTCKAQSHTTMWLRDAFENICNGVKTSIEDLDLRVKQEESFLEDVIEKQKKSIAKTQEIKYVSYQIHNSVSKIEDSMLQDVQAKHSQFDRIVNETENAGSTLKLAKENLVSLTNERDPILFLRKWENPDSVFECYDQFQKERQHKIERGDSGSEEEFSKVTQYFYEELKRDEIFNHGEDVDMEVDADIASSQHIVQEASPNGDSTPQDKGDQLQNDVMKHLLVMLKISECLPNTVTKLKEKFGEREFCQLPRVTGEYGVTINTFIGHVEEAHNYIIELNNEIVKLRKLMTERSLKDANEIGRYVSALRDLEKQDRKANRSIFDRIFGGHVENDEYEGTNGGNTERHQAMEERAATQLSLLQHSIDELKRSGTEKESTIENMRKEKDDLQSRLSSLAGKQLTKGNPAITDLSDPNRPMKIGEKYGELYDNEWTDCMDLVGEIKVLFPDLETASHDDVVVHHLHKLLLECFRGCKHESELQLKALGFTFCEESANTEEKDRRERFIFSEGDFNFQRRRYADSFAELLCKEKRLCRNILENWDYQWKNAILLEKLMDAPYFQKCVQLCWHMVLQDPMMYLEDELEVDSKFDQTLYKEFVQKGDRVKFVVWPALYLHKGGALLYKGVVQAYCTDSESKS